MRNNILINLSSKRLFNYDVILFIHVFILCSVFSQSQLFDDNKKRRVLSLAQYMENKKPVISSLLTTNSTEKKLTDSQIATINAQFKATTEKLTACVPDLTMILNESLTETKHQTSNNRVYSIVKKLL